MDPLSPSLYIVQMLLKISHLCNFGFLCRFFLQMFSPSARVLTDKEIKGLLSAADDDGDGMIGVDGKYI